MSDFLAWLHTRLAAHGADTTPDGLLARGTREEIAAFQKSKRLHVTGTATAETITALRRGSATGRDAGPPPARIIVRPLWLAELERRQGLQEVRDYGILSRWLKSDGRTLGDPRKLPWCGDAIQTAIALTLPDEPQLANPYLARNWLTFGVPTVPRLGAVMVFWRGARDGQDGHVALYVGEDETSFAVLGGNQSNAIGVTRIARGRLLGARWPKTDRMDTDAVQRALNAPLSTNEA